METAIGPVDKVPPKGGRLTTCEIYLKLETIHNLHVSEDACKHLHLSFSSVTSEYYFKQFPDVKEATKVHTAGLPEKIA